MHRRERRDDHERYLAEEHDRDDAAGQDAERRCRSARRVDRVADFELHDRNAGQFLLSPLSARSVGHDLADFADHLGQLVVADDRGLQRQHDQRQRAVFRQQLAADDLVGFDGLDEFVVVGALRQFGGEQRRRQLARRRRLARREQRDQAARAFDELQVGDEVADLFEIVRAPAASCPRPRPARRIRSRGSAWSPLRIAGIPWNWTGTAGSSELSILMRSMPNTAPIIIATRMMQDRIGALHRDQADPLQPEGDARPAAALDLFDWTSTVVFFRACPVQFSHRLNLSSWDSRRANEAESATSIGASP